MLVYYVSYGGMDACLVLYIHTDWSHKKTRLYYTDD